MKPISWSDFEKVGGLIGRQVVCVVNFPPKQVGPDEPVTPGSKIG